MQVGKECNHPNLDKEYDPNVVGGHICRTCGKTFDPFEYEGFIMNKIPKTKWNILQIGTKIRIKGKNKKDDKEGIITWYLTDSNKEIKGYAVKPSDNSFALMVIALDDDIEVVKE